ncbi:9079_t:CDS:2 [Paraglomus occultum]|uniref:9079_t:CDS:1 n=1 Tax=Paraglomus occultum TaxID=144539 RepID=A0A9N9G177_9GLOM|nr:9079_t:CDS:2 [Paraglomus occultum]
MKIPTLLAALLTIWISVAEAGLEMDLLNIDGLNTFKTKYLNNPGAASSAIAAIRRNAQTALANPNPYSVINSSVVPPDKDMHQFYSWAPYWWPNCKGIKNVKDEQTDCPYEQKDGQYVPDIGKISDPKDASKLTTDVTTMALAYALNGDENLATKTAHLLDTWFLNNNTFMKPELNFGQVIRGKGRFTGRPEGILDLRSFVYIPPVVALLEKSSVGTSLTNGLKAWFNDYSTWLLTSDLGKGEMAANNNHGSFFVAQTATYLHFADRDDDARNLISSFVSGIYQGQINKDGEQPLEAARTRPFHYQCFNLVALVYIARLSDQLNGTNVWEAKTAQGATIKTAIDYLVPITQGILTDMKNGKSVKEPPDTLTTPLYAARDHYGDPDGQYTTLLNKLLTITSGPSEFWTVWNPQALSNLNATSNSTDDDSSGFDGYDGSGDGWDPYGNTTTNEYNSVGNSVRLYNGLWAVVMVVVALLI